ncbi:hypothetical protein [Sphingobacterium arenae]|uniref:Uncharacterized protein n=1 Tax=Sphingobacterium arenae TaxID=1280598 RepID=A0ABR7Y308_9SPHI|nr:hypothetical protein [Sphingobacterium arenae]MBD1425669.1 hypothetical protein [Sphingobacterium arenae]
MDGSSVFMLYDWFVDRDNFKEFVWPAFITITTIGSSVFLSKQAFLRTTKAEKLKKDRDDAKLKEVILRNAKIVSDKVTEESAKFLESFVAGYNIEKGIKPVNMLYLFPELDVLESIDKLRYHSVFFPDEFDEDDLSNLYYALAGISGIRDTYKIISEEVIKINSFISEYDTLLMERYQKITSYLEQKILDHQKDDQQSRKVKEEELAEFYSLINEYTSNINNFYLLKCNVDKIMELEIFDVVVKEDFILYTHVMDSFVLSYLKYQQEISVFHNRIKHLVGRLLKLKDQLLLLNRLD